MSDFVVAVALQALLDDLLMQYSVDVLLAGHYQSYERYVTCRWLLTLMWAAVKEQRRPGHIPSD